MDHHPYSATFAQRKVGLGCAYWRVIIYLHLMIYRNTFPDLFRSSTLRDDDSWDPGLEPQDSNWMDHQFAKGGQDTSENMLTQTCPETKVDLGRAQFTITHVEPCGVRRVHSQQLPSSEQWSVVCSGVK